MDEVLSRKYGMTTDEAVAANVKMTELAASVGLEYHLDRVQIGNTFDAHRLIHLANDQGPGSGDRVDHLAVLAHRQRAGHQHPQLTGRGPSGDDGVTGRELQLRQVGRAGQHVAHPVDRSGRHRSRARGRTPVRRSRRWPRPRTSPTPD